MQEIRKEEIAAREVVPVTPEQPVVAEKVVAEPFPEETVVEQRVVAAEPVVEQKVVKETVAVVVEGISVQEAFDRVLVRAKGLPADAAEVVIQRAMLERYGINAERSVIRAMLNRATIV